MSDSIKCPHCHWLIRDVYEHFTELEGSVETDCENCETPIILSRTAKFYYKAEINKCQ